ncbi:MAG TPA: flagellar basal body L-ring protein FlgH [Bryobacteraceae bacterium]|nr:flagellar basal body L-ring protein FlgH [Bryobacteraceae bacterium]
MKSPISISVFLIIAMAPLDAAKKKPAPPGQSPLDRYVSEAEARSAVAPPATPGAIWQPGSRLADAAHDMRASQVDDVLTVVVAEAASAVSTGTTKTQRTSAATSSLASVPGIPKTAAALTSLANVAGNQSLNGQGTTTRTTTLNTTLTARVTHVLPNGCLVVEATKNVEINGERQTITVRGVVRPADIDPTNSILSNRLGELDVRVNGKGVVGDAIRRPFILYRLLLGLLPF